MFRPRCGCRRLQRGKLRPRRGRVETFRNFDGVARRDEFAAKLFAVDPSSTLAEAIAPIKDGATASDNGCLHLTDEKRSLALLKEWARR
jgi:hypothetical protein